MSARLAVPAEMGAFLRWWAAELQAAFAPIVGFSRWRQSEADIYATPDATIIERVRGRVGERFVQDTPIEALDPDNWAELGEIAGGRRARLILSGRDIFTSSLRLPRQAAGRLRQVVALQLPEIAPLDPDALCWGVRAVPYASDQILATVAFARLEKVEAVVSAFITADLPPPRLIAKTDDGHELSLPYAMADVATRPMPPWVIAAALLCSIPLSTLFVSSILIWTNQSAIAAAEPVVEARAQDERKWKQAQQARSAFASIAREPSLAKLLDQLAVALPSNTSLVSAERGPGRDVSFVLETTDPQKVRDVLEGASGLDVSEADEIPAEGDMMRVTYRGTLA